MFNGAVCLLHLLLLFTCYNAADMHTSVLANVVVLTTAINHRAEVVLGVRQQVDQAPDSLPGVLHLFQDHVSSLKLGGWSLPKWQMTKLTLTSLGGTQAQD